MVLFMMMLMVGVTMTETESQTRARLSQVALTVTDLTVAKEFYSTKLRLPLRYELPNMLIYELGGATLVLSLPEETVPHSADGAVVYFEVDDLEATREAMKSRGTPFIDEPHVVHREGSRELWMTFLRDPDGHLLALTSWR